MHISIYPTHWGHSDQRLVMVHARITVFLMCLHISFNGKMEPARLAYRLNAAGQKGFWPSNSFLQSRALFFIFIFSSFLLPGEILVGFLRQPLGRM